MRARRSSVVALVVSVLLAGVAGAEEAAPSAAMMRYPDVSQSDVVFLYAGDLWLVGRGGGVARPLASPPGEEVLPKFSPDGKTIAFVGNYDGNRDLYTVPVAGGVPFRVTHHPTAESLCDWTPGGELVFAAAGLGQYPRAAELFRVPAAGGLPAKLPVPYGARAAISPDGQWLAYTPHTADHRTWKRYRGGMATDIWLFHLEQHTSRRVTDWEGTDSFPMWHGETLYYLADAGPEHRLNLWAFDTRGGNRRQVTRFADYDVKWPSIGPGSDGRGEIVFQNGSDLYLLDLSSTAPRKLEVTVPGARAALRPRWADATELVFDRELSATGKRVLLEARGDIWSVPARDGSARNLTLTDGAAERDPAWSPDGKWVAYFSDRGGEYQLLVAPADGRGEPRVLTERASGFLFDPTWSPDSRRIAFWDQSGALLLASLDGGEVETLDREPHANQPPLSWSADSRWLAYAKGEEGNALTSAIWVHDTREGKAHRLTSGRYVDSWPTFDREGKYLFFASQRDFSSPVYEDVGTTWVYADTDRLYVAPLRRDLESPFAPRSDEETGEEEDEGEGQGDDETGKGKGKGKCDGEADEGDKPEKPPDVTVDLDGFERRAVALPVDRGGFGLLAVDDDGHLLYVRMPPRGSDGEAAVKIFDPERPKPGMARMAGMRPGGPPAAEEEAGATWKERTVVEGVDGFRMSADGKRLLVWKGERMAVVDAEPDQKMTEPVPVGELRALVDPRAEWRQIFNETWRLQRDFFYDPNMHGVDWPAVRRQYEAMLADCASREDLSFVLSEMISELNVGHAYYFGGDVERGPKVAVGLPGCDFEVSGGAFRIARILEGGAADVDARGPLSQPGVDARVGDYLLEVNGVPVTVDRDPWAAFQGLAGKVATLTLSSEPRLDEKARDVVVELLESDQELRYWAWVEANRARVERASGGRVGYVYVPNTGVEGQNHLVRQFYGQTGTEALIVDERWNGGGQIPTRFIELLDRPVANYWALRWGRDWTWPPDSHQGPKCMLINGLAGSGGDYFPFYFRARGLGPLIGTRTWGGLVGISGGPPLLDGAVTTMPAFAFYEKDGTWGIEGHGVDPDLEVVDDPALMADGGDPQLDRAVQLMLEELERNPPRRSARPPYPDRSGMGIRPEDR